MTSFTYLALLIATLLTIGTVFIYQQIKQKPTAERLKNIQRLLVWWMIFALCVIIFSLGLIGIGLLITSLLCWAVVEIFILYEQRLDQIKIVMLCSFSVVLVSLIVLYPQFSYVIYYIAIVNAVVSFFIVKSSPVSIIAFCSYFAFSLFSILLISVLAHKQSTDVPHLLLVLFFITSVNDIAQYITGKRFGKTPIAPLLSPNKTVEGLCGGVLVSAILGALLLPTVFSMPIFSAAAFGCLISIAGFFGDLLISKLKRELKVKNTGHSIAGHGGILDRIDSLLLIAPAFGLTLNWFGFL